MEWGGSWKQALPGRTSGLALLLVAGLSLVHEFWPPYRSERSLRDGLAAVSRGIVDSSRHALRRSGDAVHYYVVYHFPVAGVTYRGQGDCQCLELANLRAGDVLSIRYARADPSVNRPDDVNYSSVWLLMWSVVGAACVLAAAVGFFRTIVAGVAAPPAPQSLTSLRSTDGQVDAPVVRQSPHEWLDDVRDVLEDLDAHLLDVGQRVASGQHPAGEEVRELEFFVGRLKLLLHPDDEAHAKLLAAAEKAVAESHNLTKGTADAFAAAGLELVELGQLVLRKEPDATT